jgi:hypothetical protein
MLRVGDKTEFSIKREVFNQKTYNFIHSQQCLLFQKMFNFYIEFNMVTNLMKFLSKEKKFSLTLNKENSPFSFKLEQTLRKNIFDEFSCLQFQRDSILESFKSAFLIEWQTRKENLFSSANLELSCSEKGVKIVKLSTMSAFKLNLIKDKFRLVSDITGGVLVSKLAHEIPLNDRFFLYNEYGFNFMGHSEKSEKCNLISSLTISEEESREYTGR